MEKFEVILTSHVERISIVNSVDFLMIIVIIKFIL